MDLLHIRHRLLGGAHVGFGDDLQQGCAGAVEVDAGQALKVFVQGFAGVFFQVGAGNADGLGLAVLQLDLYLAMLHHRQFVLADLVALGQVGIEIILAREHRTRRHRGLYRQAELGRHAHRFLIQYRQHPGQAQVHGAGLCVGRRAVGGGGAGEDLAIGGNLRVDLKPNYCFPFHFLTLC